MLRAQDWKIIYQKQQVDINRIPFQIIESRHQPTSNVSINSTMQQNKVRQIKYFTNYFVVNNIPIYFQSLITMAKILYIDPNQLYQQFQSFKIKMKQLEQSTIEGLQTRKAKIQVCFSRRWRETIITIYVVFHRYVTIQKTNKMRALIINERGLIMQAHSNIDQTKCFVTIIRYLKSFSRLQNIVLLAPDQSSIDIDSMNLIRDNFVNGKVVWVGYHSRESICSIGHNLQHSLIHMEINNGMKVAQYKYQQISIWHHGEIIPQLLNHFILKLSTILTRQKRIKSFFKDYLYESNQFNQKQFLLRLFSFCNNFVTIQGLDNECDNIILDMLSKNCISELIKKKKELQKSTQKDVHQSSTNSTPLVCPVCKNKSKYICMKCSQQFQTKFGLCDHKCFQEFHSNRLKYAPQLSNQRKVTDLSIQIKSQMMQHNESSNEENSDNNTKTTNNYHNIRTMRELREKWDKIITKERHEFDHFMKMCSMKYAHKNIIDRINLLDTKISLMTTEPPQIKITIKKQQP